MKSYTYMNILANKCRNIKIKTYDKIDRYELLWAKVAPFQCLLFILHRIFDLQNINYDKIMPDIHTYSNYSSINQDFNFELFFM